MLTFKVRYNNLGDNVISLCFRSCETSKGRITKPTCGSNANISGWQLKAVSSNGSLRTDSESLLPIKGVLLAKLLVLVKCFDNKMV